MGAIQELIAPVDHLVFDTELALDQQVGAQLLPFRGMDKSGMAICVFYNRLTRQGCESMDLCPYRHIVGEKSVVCKHWLRGLCKKGDECEFLHEYNLDRMPECFFYSKYSWVFAEDASRSSLVADACNNKECPFRHVDPDQRIKDCPWYERGFCRHGPHCKSRHRRRVLCIGYMNGLCVKGPLCKHAHPTFDLPKMEQMIELRNGRLITCHNCNQKGHKASQCPHSVSMAAVLAQQHRQQPMGAARSRAYIQQQQSANRPPLSEITCFKCGEKGHFANRCNKTGMSFLSSSS